MKKTLLFSFIIAVFGALSAKAQPQLNFGAKGGVNFSTLRGNDAGGYSSLTGAHFGGIVSLAIPRYDNGLISFAIQGELCYSMQGASFDNGKITLSYLNLPVMIQHYIASSGFYIESGPQVGFLLAAKSTINGVSKDIKKSSKKVDVSINAGLGYVFQNALGISARYSLGGFPVSSDGTTVLNGVISAGLFYIFGQNKY